MSVHTHTVFALLAIDIEGIFLIIALGRHNHGKAAVYQLRGKCKPNLIGMPLDVLLGVIKNQPHILPVQQGSRRNLRLAEQLAQSGILHLCIDSSLRHKVFSQIHANAQTYQRVLLRGIILHQLLTVFCHRQQLIVVLHNNYPVGTVHGLAYLSVIHIEKNKPYKEQKKTHSNPQAVSLIRFGKLFPKLLKASFFTNAFLLFRL